MTNDFKVLIESGDKLKGLKEVNRKFVLRKLHRFLKVSYN